MANILLIHGACHGGWCWARVVPGLAARGHLVLTPDLPGHGDDPTPASALSLDGYARAIIDLLADVGQPMILVGHSMAGAVISRIAERAPERVERLIYLTAYMPQSDQSLASLARRDTESRTASERVEIDGTDCFTITRGVARAAFYQDASDDIFEFAARRFCPEPVSVFRDKAPLTDQRFGQVPRDYIHCTEDRAIGHTLQQEMVRDLPCERVITLESGHSPFLTMPGRLTEVLASLCE